MSSRQLTLCAILAGAISLTGCSNRKATTDNLSAIAECDSLPQSVKELVKAVADNDSARFASLVSYPLSRPYPLHDITDASEMKKYYSTLVDDSLHKVLTETAPDGWQKFGWRGWSVADGEYIWMEDSIYNVPYTSRRELAKIESIRSQELATLPKHFAKEWTPVRTYRQHNGNRVLRIDRKDGKNGEETYRLMIYAQPPRIGENPETVLTGAINTEGTVMAPVYSFKAPDGSKAELDAEPTDGSLPVMTFTDKRGNRIFELEPSYWLDLVK